MLPCSRGLRPRIARAHLRGRLMNILAIESSCDETACAVIRDGTEIVSNVIASSTAMHEKWGGIVPEVAAREQLVSIIPVLTEALSCFSHTSKKSLALSTKLSFKEIIMRYVDAIAVTVGPGLIGSLLIGVEAAKTIAFITGKPIIPVNHVLAHIYGNFLSFARPRLAKLNNQNIRFPAISLVVSGGHTELFLMKSEKDMKWLGGTIDDAAGEAFDKTARLLGFGSRGGLAIQEAAKTHNCHCDPAKGGRSNLYNKDRHASLAMTKKQKTISFPRPMMYDETLNFSFSGLKTAVMREVNKLKTNQQPASRRGADASSPRVEAGRSGLNKELIEQLSFEVQEAITDVLVAKTMKAAELYHAKSILISGGVASNEQLRNKFILTMEQCNNVTIVMPPASLCTDNAAFIGSYAYFRGVQEDWHTITAIPDLPVEE